MKKIFAILASFAFLVGFFAMLPGSASASSRRFCGPRHHDPKPNEETVVNEDNDKVVVKVSNFAFVKSSTVAMSNTGGNTQKWNDDNNSIDTGKAQSVAESQNVVNSTNIEINQD
jgi:hypothetical protein